MPNSRHDSKNDAAELVFGLVYGVGTDSEEVVRVLEDYLKQFRYQPRAFRISQHLSSLKLDIEFDDSSPVNLMHALMDAGNKARKISNSEDILAVSAINHILDKREKDELQGLAPAFNVAQIIRSLKRPEEVALLRNVYRPGFYLIGIAADDDEQQEYLCGRKGLRESEARKLIERDQDEVAAHGQRMRDTFYLSDVFVEIRQSKYKEQLWRFLELIFGHPFVTPTRDENAMFMAYASAARSAQIGRQVGASIATEQGEVTAVGFNEVPSNRGGPYWEGDRDDHRDHKEGKDSNSENRKRIVDSILGQLKGKILDDATMEEVVRITLEHSRAGESGPELSATTVLTSLKEKQFGTNLGEVRKLINASDLKEITEYGRAVHAEMDAILTSARLGMSPNGKYLYTTTFPCHNCTRHIIASGIKKVIYIEPYPKSKARDLHSDAICFDEDEARSTGKIPFVPFVGIGPRRYLDLFSHQLTSGAKVERKGEDGKPVEWDSQHHKGPRIPMENYGYVDREQKVLDENKAKLRVLTAAKEN